MSAARPVAPRFRHEVRADDPGHVRAIVAASGFFTPAETAVAVELVEERLLRGAASGYFFIFAEAQGRVVGYACYGPVPATLTTWDLYWIAVDPERRRGGLGRALLTRAEQAIAAAGGRDVYIETSSRGLYGPTREFYLAAGYRLAAEFADFYAPGDGKLVYVKRL
jgi:D-alanine-D-alanine ligase